MRSFTWTLVLLSSSACGRQPTTPAGTRDVRIGQDSEIHPMNPAIGAQGFLAPAQYLVFDSLIARDATMQTVPRLLEGWQILDAGSRLRLKLRSNIRFQDGQLLTSNDLIFTLTEIRKPENGSPFGEDLAVIKSIARIDNLTVDLMLARPFPHLIDLLDFGILPRHLLAGQKLADNPFNEHPIGAGPYRVQRLAKDRLDLIANVDYYGGRPPLDKLTVFQYDAEELWRRLLARQIDFAIMVPWSKQHFLRNLKTVRLDQSGRILGTSLRFNTTRPPFDQRAARVAFSAAIERQRLVQRSNHGFGVPSDRLDPTETIPPKHDVEEARRLLAGKIIRLSMIKTEASEIDAAMEIQRQMAAIDVDVRIVPMNDLSKWRDHAEALFSYITSPTPFEDVAYLYRDPRIPEINQIFQAISENTSEDERTRLFRNLESIVLKDSTRAVLYWQPALSAYRTRYCSFHMTNIMADIDHLRLCS